MAEEIFSIHLLAILHTVVPSAALKSNSPSEGSTLPQINLFRTHELLARGCFCIFSQANSE